MRCASEGSPRILLDRVPPAPRKLMFPGAQKKREKGRAEKKRERGEEKRKEEQGRQQKRREEKGRAKRARDTHMTPYLVPRDPCMHLDGGPFKSRYVS